MPPGLQSHWEILFGKLYFHRPSQTIQLLLATAYLLFLIPVSTPENLFLAFMYLISCVSNHLQDSASPQVSVHSVSWMKCMSVTIVVSACYKRYWRVMNECRSKWSILQIRSSSKKNLSTLYGRNSKHMWQNQICLTTKPILFPSLHTIPGFNKA